MCSLCGVMAKEHWAELGDGPRRRLYRATVLNRVLEHYGLSVQSWAGRGFVLRDRKGAAAVVADLGALWIEAERLHGSALDPLAPDLIAALER